MNRIAAKFAELRAAGRKAFIPFVTAGDPDLETSGQIVLKLAELGADIVELGVPFSDPMADGPTIQRSSQRALDNGVTLGAVLAMARGVRADSEVPLVLFSYLNPILRYGFDRFAKDASDAGIDGVLLTDVVNDEAAEIAGRLAAFDIDLISLIAPTTSDVRLEAICERASGFIYAVSRAGVTGARDETSSTAAALVRRARAFTDLPIAVGFGISTSKQITDVWAYADGAVVGSAIVSEIEEAGENNSVERVAQFVTRLVPEFAESRGEN